MLTYRDLLDFQDTYLDDSFLDAIVEGDDRVAFDVSLTLLPGHPRYEPPKEGEACWWEPASIVFTDVTVRHWARRTGMVLRGPDGSEDLGAIDTIHESAPGRWVVAGDFGEVHISSGPPTVAYR